MMKKHLFILVVGALLITACTHPFEKEMNQVDGLLLKADGIEKTLLSIDTAKVFAVKRQMEADLVDFNSVQDTLTKVEAFVVADIFGNKKKIYRITSNYADFTTQLGFAKHQLNNLKADLENKVIKKEVFEGHFNSEESALMELNMQIEKGITGLEVALQKFDLDRVELMKIIEKRKMNATPIE